MNTLAGWNRKWDQNHTVFNLGGVTVGLISDQVTRFAKNCGIFHCKAVVLNMAGKKSVVFYERSY